MKQVLIIEDSPRIRERIAGLLAESDEIRLAGQAGNGRDAIDAVQRLKPDAVILDIRLPDLSGIELLRTFKARYPKMAVIMLTNLNDASYRRQCRLLGADHFLSKTLDLGKIVDTIIDNLPHSITPCAQRKE